MAKFKVGDEVVFKGVRPFDGEIFPEMTGIVICFYQENWVGVEWDGYDNGHDCDGNCQYGGGYYVFETDLELNTISLENE